MEKDDTVLRQYILVTPAKNEEKNLSGCISSVAKQTIKPVLWAIIDDGSTDNTPEIIKETKEKNDWIKNITLEESVRDLGIHYSYVCKKGFDFAIEYCKEHEIRYDYVGLVDADIFLEESYFEGLIKEFEKDHRLGTASGETRSIVKEKTIRPKQQENLPSGAARLWRKECFEEIGGYSLTCSADSVSNVKAKLKGWKTRRFKEYKFTQRRMTASANGLWKGWMELGKSAYYLNAPPIFAFVRAIRYLFERPYYIGLAYLFGYLNSYVFGKEQTDDDEIRQYYRHTRPRELKDFYLNKIKKFFRLKT